MSTTPRLYFSLTMLAASLVIVVPVLASSVSAASTPAFTLTKLDPFGAGAGDVIPVAINDKSQITGYVMINSSVAKGFFYQPAAHGQAAHPHALPVPKGDISADFNSLNNQGEAAGYVCIDVGCHRYLPYGGVINGSKATLTPLPSPLGAKVSRGSGFQINASGAITGYAVLSNGQDVGLEWKSSGPAAHPRWSTPIRLSIPFSFKFANGIAIDAQGDVAGNGSRGKFDLGTIAGTSGPASVLPGFNGTKVPNVTQSYPLAVYSAGPAGKSANRMLTVVGYSYESGTVQDQRDNPCVWTVTVKAGRVIKVSNPVQLGQDYNDPAGGNGAASSLNSHGWVVGDAGVYDSFTPMLWVRSSALASSPYDSFQLQNLVPFDSPSFALDEAVSVNNEGRDSRIWLSLWYKADQLTGCSH